MSRHHARTASVRTIRSEASSAAAWVVLLEPADMVAGSPSAQLPHRLLRQGFSVLSLRPGSACPAAALRTAIAEAAAEVREESDGRLPVLFAGTGRLAGVAARAAIDHDGAGLLSLNGSLLRATWHVSQLPAPILLLGSPDLPWTTSGALRLSAGALGKRARFVGLCDRDDRTERAVADWGRAVVRGGWPETARRSLRVAVPMAAALAVAPAAGVLLSGTPVAAAQRAGDGVVRAASPAVGQSVLSGVVVKAHQRHGDGTLRHNELSHTLSATSLTDAAGFRWVVNTDVTATVSASSASGAINDQAGFTHSVTVSTTSHGGTTQSAMSAPYAGYGGLLLSVNGTVCAGASADCTIYGSGSAAQTDCNGRELLFNPTPIDGLNVSRRVYVPSDDHFERTLNVFSNPTGAAITVTMSTANFLKSGTATTVTGTSAGGTTVAPTDEWVTTGGAFSSGKSVSPRLGHVLQTTGAAVGAAHVNFSNGNPNPNWAYTFTVGAGQTVIIGNYAVADGTLAAAQADSARLAALPSTALECMSATDQAELGNFASAPTVTEQPQNAVAEPGATVNFSASATAAGIGQAPSVQWQQSLDGGANWTNIAGAISPALSVVTPAGGADYRAVFHNGFGTTISQAASLTLPPPTPPTPPSPPAPSPGFWLSDTAGGVYSYGAPFEGSLPGLGVHPATPVVGMAGTADGAGYMMVGANGGVYAFGDAHFAGSLPGLGIAVDNVVGLALSPGGDGYWMVSNTGAVFAFGGAPFLGSLPALGVTPSAPIVGMAATQDGHGYWLVAADGAVYAFGDAPYLGSLPGLHVTPARPITGIAVTPDGRGYWMVGSDGAIYAFGDAPYEGSLPGLGVQVSKPIIGMAAAGQDGYWLFGSDGGTFAFGSAPYLGSAVGFTSGRSIGATAAS
jgi:hypothetical protein